MPLTEYRRKRRFTHTPEPIGKKQRKRASRLTFVVQKHDATRPHYDFRLEFDGVLKSWAVPKGPSLDPAEKRLAVEVEDHPLEYGKFEGVIPAGEYGGGAVLLWDRGVWSPSEDAASGLASGKLKFRLHGEKLNGGWTLVRIRTLNGSKPNWLLIKENDEFARSTTKFDVVKQSVRSVVSDRTIEQIAAAPDTERRGSKAVQANRKSTTAAPSSESGPIEIAGVRITHPERVLYPGQGITKRSLAEYYLEIADWILPHLEQRPLSLVRCPSGEGKNCFYQKHPGPSAPKQLERVAVKEKNKTEEYAIVNDMAGLVSLAQIGVLEIHPWGSRVDKLERPDRLIFDLDPADDVPWTRVIEAAGRLRALLEELGLTSFLKTTGGKGLHLVVPINRRTDWDDAKQFAKLAASHLEKQAPEAFTTNMSKARRTGKIFLDYLRNDRGATAVCAYSTRSRPGAPVSTPLAWDELNPRIRSDTFTVDNILRRLESLREDPWRDLATTRQSITAAAIKSLA